MCGPCKKNKVLHFWVYKNHNIEHSKGLFPNYIATVEAVVQVAFQVAKPLGSPETGPEGIDCILSLVSHD